LKHFTDEEFLSQIDEAVSKEEVMRRLEMCKLEAKGTESKV